MLVTDSPGLRSTNGTTQRVALVLVAILCWLICTIAQVEKYLSPGRAAVVCTLGCTFVAGLMIALRWFYRTGRDTGRWILASIFCVLVFSFAVSYPKSQRHEVGKGSDREDALRVELMAIRHHQYPYDARTFLHNPPTPLPGALWLASPFFLTSRIAFQNMCWVAIFLIFLTRFFRHRVTAAVFATLFLLTSLENLNDLDVGGDYVTNICYVAVALFLFVRAIERRRTGWLTVAAVTLLGVSLSSRVIYVVSLLPLLAFALQKTTPRRVAMLFGSVIAISLLVTLPVFFPHPVTRLLAQLGQNSDKLHFLPRFLAGPVLPAAALALSATSFFVRMDLSRVYLATGLSTLVMIFPPMAFLVHEGGAFKYPFSADLEYLAVSAIFISLWVFAKWEKTASEVSTP